ncbi:MAG: ATPase [Paenibacillus sp.]|nr:ATPase [Paenibacillus sp.]
MKRILIIGCAGSGKSTLSRKLGNLLHLPVIHLDKYYWKPNWEATPNEEWDRTIEQFVQRDEWIMDGNYSRTMDVRIKRADLIIYLDMPTYLCLYRILKRRIMYNKQTRPDLNEHCPEKLDWAFIKWVWSYRKKSRMKTIRKLEQVQEDKQVVLLQHRKQVQAYINQLAASSQPITV